MLTFLLACAVGPDAPPEILYDHVACAHCAMLVSDPESVAALTETGGATRIFDDPGCLLRYMAAEHPSVRHLWFHHGNQWFSEGDVAFRGESGLTPMGSGLVAVAVGTPGALTVGEASGRILAAP